MRAAQAERLRQRWAEGGFNHKGKAESRRGEKKTTRKWTPAQRAKLSAAMKASAAARGMNIRINDPEELRRKKNRLQKRKERARKKEARPATTA
jgi:hypothetical protein